MPLTRAGRLAIAAFSLALTLLAGCGPSGPRFSGTMKFGNRSDDTLYVSALSGFDRDVGCGYLVPSKSGTTKEQHLGRMGYPRQSTITWRVGDGPDQSQALDLDAALRNDRAAALVLVYTRDGKWEVTAEPSR